jgi:AcrR family transcriptional regulator
MAETRVPGEHRTTVRAGRPRSPTADVAILQSCFEILSEVGYTGMTVEAVAARAGVTRPTIYRRWPSRAALAVAALARAQEGIRDLPETGAPRADLVAHLESLKQTLNRPFGMAIIGSILAEEHDTPVLLDGFRSLVIGPRRAPIRRIMSEMRLDGKRLSPTEIDVRVDLLVGACYARYVSGQPFHPRWARAVVDAILAGCTEPSP